MVLYGIFVTRVHCICNIFFAGMAARLAECKFHAGRPRERRQLRGLLHRWGQTLSHLRRRRQTCQNLGLSGTAEFKSLILLSFDFVTKRKFIRKRFCFESKKISPQVFFILAPAR